MNIVSAVRRTCAEVSALFSDDPLLRRWRKQIYFGWVAMRNPAACGRWYEFLDSAPVRPFIKANPSLPLKPFKPYLALGLKVGDRVRIIHDSLSLQAGRWNAFQDIINGSKPVAASIDLGADGVVTLCLEINHQKEGELTLLLRMPDRQIAAIAAFAFERRPDGAHVMRIARIQGVKDHEMLRRLEKAMHGLRPKSLMLFASQEVAHALGVGAIFGVSNAQQVYKDKVLIPLPGLHKLAFDYDGFWKEADGAAEPDGWFRLPARLEKREPSEMKPNKRSMYKKRYAMLDDISAQIHRALGASTGVPAGAGN
jgi:uncharacterized protein VirK/YbjX